MSCLEPTIQQIEEVRKCHEATEESIKRDVEIVQAWIRQQKHLPQNVTADWFIEICLVRNKFLVERVKAKIDFYYSSKTFYKRFFENNNHILPSTNPVCFFPGLLTPKLERIVYLKAAGILPESLNVEDQVKYFVMVHELEMKYDYPLSKIIIIDLAELTFDLVKRVDLQLIRDYGKLWTSLLSGRVKAIHCINTPSYMNLLLTLAKPVMSSKMYNRINLHKNVDSLYQDVPKEHLISDFGGEDKSMKEYTDFMDQVFNNHRPFFKQLPNICTNEEFRVGNTHDYGELAVFGGDGTFKKINLD